MGDVSNAMERSRDRDDKPGNPRGQGPIAQEGDDVQPALPLDQVKARSVTADEPARLPVSSGRTVSNAVAKSEAEREARNEQLAVPSAKQDPSLNGYSAQVIVHHDRGSVITEQYRAIRTQILARARNRRLQTHVITSSSPEEGKSVTTVNLGMTFSELRNQRTLLIEGDLRRPSFGRVLNRTCSPGMLQYLRGEVDDIDKILHPTFYENLQFIPAGSRDQTSSTELLSSPRMAQLLDRLKDRYDHIFIDTPPVVTVTDAAILGALADETLLIVRLGKTPTDLVDRAKRLLRAANCEVAGVILTHLELSAPKYLYRYAYK